MDPTRNIGNSPGPSVRSNQTFGALYEIIPATTNPPSGEIARLNIGYSRPNDGNRESEMLSLIDEGDSFTTASADFKFAAAIASFGMILNRSPFIGSATLRDVAAWAPMGAERNPDSEKMDFVDLVRDAQRLEK
jgi:Ca-activated chloride channel family protein